MARGVKEGAVASEDGAGCGTCVTDGEEYGAIEDATLNEAGREGAVETTDTMLCLFDGLPIVSAGCIARWCCCG